MRADTSLWIGLASSGLCSAWFGQAGWDGLTWAIIVLASGFLLGARYAKWVSKNT